MKKILLLLCFGLCASAWAQVEKNEPSELDKEFVEQIKAMLKMIWLFLKRLFKVTQK